MLTVTPQRKGMGSHQRADAGKDEWLTPPWVKKPLGKFDLDPCAPINPPWKTAEHTYTIEDNGLTKPWFGRVWLNPPYGSKTVVWLARLADHGNGIALIFARTETQDWFTQVWNKASGILFFEGRLFFHHVTGERAASNGGAPSALIAYGEENARVLAECGIAGALVRSPQIISGTSREIALL